MVETRKLDGKPVGSVAPIPIPVTPPPCKPLPIKAHVPCRPPVVPPPVEKKLRGIALDAVNTLEEKFESELTDATERANNAAAAAEAAVDSMVALTEVEINRIIDEA